MKTIAIAAVLVLVTPAAAPADQSVDNAYRVCAVFNGTGLLSQECSVSGWHSSIDVTVDMSASEAREFCGVIAPYLAQLGVTFSSGWKVRIYSPYSGDRTIAFCPL